MSLYPREKATSTSKRTQNHYASFIPGRPQYTFSKAEIGFQLSIRLRDTSEKVERSVPTRPVDMDWMAASMIVGYLHHIAW
jgi:hypothetical protein